MAAEEPQQLTTGKVAELLAVQPDTVLKWIKKGQIIATRTPGGHHRIDRCEVERLIESRRTSTAPPASEAPPARTLRCWEYFSKDGQVREACTQCIVYRVRASWCFKLRALDGAAGHARQFCETTCEDCVYYQRVQQGAVRILVITSDNALAHHLQEQEMEDLVVRFASNAYQASAMVERVRPAFAVVDEDLPFAEWKDLVECLAADPRIPGVKIILAAPSGSRHLATQPPTGVLAVLPKPIHVTDLQRVIATLPVEQNLPESFDAGAGL